MQEAWLRAWQNLDQFQATDPAAFKAWLEQIVQTVGLNAARAIGMPKRRPPGGWAALDSTGEYAPGPGKPPGSVASTRGCEPPWPLCPTRRIANSCDSVSKKAYRYAKLRPGWAKITSGPGSGFIGQLGWLEKWVEGEG